MVDGNKINSSSLKKSPNKNNNTDLSKLFNKLTVKGEIKTIRVMQ